MLTPGRDYLFFERVDCTQQSLITTMIPRAVVVTRSLLVLVPLDEPAVLAFVKAVLVDDAVDATKLDNVLVSTLGGSHTRSVFPLGELETLRVTAGFFGEIVIKMPGESVRRLAIRDKGGKLAAKDFLAGHLQQQAAS